MSNLAIKVTKNHNIGDSVIKRCHVVHCFFKVDYSYFTELFTQKEEIFPDVPCYVGEYPTKISYRKPLGYLKSDNESFRLSIPSKGYISGRFVDSDKKEAIVDAINITGKRSLSAFRQLWQLLEKSIGKLEMYLLWQDGSCYSLKLEGSKRTSDILNEYPKELVGNDLL